MDINARQALSAISLTTYVPNYISITTPLSAGKVLMFDQYVRYELAGETGSGWSDRGIMLPASNPPPRNVA